MDPLDDTDVIRKVMLLDAVEVYEVHGPLVYTESMDLATVVAVNPVPVIGNSGRIGFATVDLEHANLDTKVFLTKECLERLDLENGEPYYLSIGNAHAIREALPLKRLEYYLKHLEIVSIHLLSAKGGTNLPLVTKGPL